MMLRVRGEMSGKACPQHKHLISWNLFHFVLGIPQTALAHFQPLALDITYICPKSPTKNKFYTGFGIKRIESHQLRYIVKKFLNS
jgi:hypothetical protein